MKQKLNVIDLDNTLLPYDSFRKYIFLFLKNPRTSFHFAFLLFQRKFRLINASYFKKHIVKAARKTPGYNQRMKSFATQLHHDISASVICQINENTDGNTKTLLCTASVEDYVKYLSDLLGWEYVCSMLNEKGENFIHMYGDNKITEIQKLYPPEKYYYNFAISDSISDEVLLKKFNTSILLK
jgi:phosphoserine phosphatase